MDLAARREALGRSQLFRTLQPAELEAVLSQAIVRRMARNGVVLRRGDPSMGTIVIVSGRVRVGVMSEDGREVTLGVLGPGEILGEMSVLHSDEVSADVTALEDCVMLVIERNRFLRLLRSNNELCLRLLGVLCGRLRRLNATLEDMALLDLQSRLGRLLLKLAADYGSPSVRGTRIEVRLSQKDLSTIVGGSREKVNKQLRQWEQDGILAKDAGRIVILRPETLSLVD
jgi:CRP-like cAMP-binding protein